MRGRLALAVALSGCPSEEPSSSGSSADGMASASCEGTGIVPFRDDWVLEGDFALPDDVQTIRIGGRLTGGTDRNFANRGDVVVGFDGEPGRIVIEMRRFTAAFCEATAAEDFADLSLWAYAGVSGDPLPPGQMDPTASCLEGGWRDGCSVRVYYDGLSQLARSGADLRVTLPADYRGLLDIVTEDNDADPDYFNRGDVCVLDLPGSAEIELGSGRAFVRLAADITPSPRCAADDVATCESWPCAGPDDACDGSQAWANECPCVAQLGEFGRVNIDTADIAAMDAQIDLPASLWSSITARNEGPGQTLEEHCAAIVDVPGYVQLDGPGNDFPWETRGTVSYPGLPAVAGAGYAVQLFSSACAPVPHTDVPEDFVGTGQGGAQASEVRGGLHVCTGCLSDVASCDDLVF